jgi:hypothetical protein
VALRVTARAARDKEGKKAAAAPDALVRVSAGEYRSGDERFTVSQQGGAWYVTDAQLVTEFGQPLLLGPFSSLKAARTAADQARAEPPRPAPKPPKRPAPRARSQDRQTKRRSEPPPSWIDRLPAADQPRARRLVRALAKAGVRDAEDVARADVGGLLPAAATRLIMAAIEAELDSVEGGQRPAARRITQRVLSVLTQEGLRQAPGLPGWTLIETDADGAPGRRITLTNLGD